MTESGSRGLQKETRVILGLIISHLAIVFYFYPRFYLSEDSKRIIEAAYHILHDGFDPSLWVPYTMQTGNALFIIPTLLVGFDFIFAGNIILHGISSLIFLRLLKQMGYPRIYVVLFLLNPSLILFSRTPLSETLAVFLILLALLFYTFWNLKLN